MYMQIIGLIGLCDRARDAEVAEGVLDEVGPQHLKDMHNMGGKTERSDAPWSQQKTPCKTNFKRKKWNKLVAVAAEPVQGGRTHGEN